MFLSVARSTFEARARNVTLWLYRCGELLRGCASVSPWLRQATACLADAGACGKFFQCLPDGELPEFLLHQPTHFDATPPTGPDQTTIKFFFFAHGECMCKCGFAFHFGGWLLWWYCIFTIPHEFYSMQIMFGRFIFGVGSQWFFSLQTWNLNLRTKWCGVLAIYFHGVKERNPNHEQKQNQSTKETARDTHSSHSSIPPDNTLRIINCTNRIISISKKLFCLFGKICLFKNIPLWISQKILFEKAGTEQFWKNYDLWQTLTCHSVKKYPQASCEGSIRIKYMGKFFPRCERGIRFFQTGWRRKWNYFL